MAQLIRSWRSRRGVAAVEFALTLPVFLLVLTGVIELSNFISNFHHVQRAARDGARVGSITLEGPNPNGDLIRAAAAEQALFVLEASGKPCEDGCTISTDWYQDGDYMMVEVIVEYPYTPLTWLYGQLAEQSVAQFTMMTQQQA
jgi:hypothetical protein